MLKWNNFLITGEDREYLKTINVLTSTLSDADQHLAGKIVFCKLDSFQAYQSFQMTEQRSKELLAFNFASTTIAHRRLAPDLSRALSAFSSLVGIPKQDATFTQHESSFQTISQNWVEIDNRKMPLWG